jgi:hypothetical protein
MSRDNDIQTLKEQIAEGNLVTIVGTGVSVAACGGRNAPPAASWTGLMQLGLQHCVHKGVFDQGVANVLEANLKTGDTRLLIGVAEIIHQGLLEKGGGKDGVFRGWLNDTIGKLKPTNAALLDVIRALPGVLATLNYDSLLEGGVRSPCTWQQFHENQQALLGDPKRVVLHLHGHYQTPASVVLGVSSYIKVRDDEEAKAIRHGLLTTKSVLFVGCGDTFLDPNFTDWLNWARVAQGNAAPRHAMLCRTSEHDSYLKKINAPWLNIISYGDDYGDLMPFLTDLLPATTRPAVQSPAGSVVYNFPNKTNTYNTWLAEATKAIELRGFCEEPLPLEHVYVPLAAECKGGWGATPIALNQVFGLEKHLAITGGAGSGKSTILRNMAWVLADARATQDLTRVRRDLGWSGALGELPLPILAPLATLAALRRDHNIQGLAKLISRYLTDKHAATPPDFFERLLADNARPVMLLLDGLDEVPSLDERDYFRRQVIDFIGNFNFRMVVSCRTIVYEGADGSSLGAKFAQIAVLPLDREAHVKPLVEQAYAWKIQHEPRVAKDSAARLLTEIAHMEEQRKQNLGDKYTALVVSPLMVRMMLIVHAGNGTLPNDRAELFEKTVQALLKAQYKPEREHLPDAQERVSAQYCQWLQHLAFQMHQMAQVMKKGPKDQRSVSIEEPALRVSLSQVIDSKEDLEKFIAVAADRGTLLQRIDKRFSFVHFALQEFLAARYVYEVLANVGADQQAAIAAILPRLDDDWWREPWLLLLGYWAYKAPEGADELLRQLAKAGKGADAQFAAAELAGAAALEVPVKERGDLQQHCAHSITGLLSDNAVLLASKQPRLRVNAGNLLGRLGDPRFDPQRFYLPADEDLGFVKIKADKDFKIGTRSALRQQVKDATGVDVADHEINDAPTPTGEFYIARYPVTVAQFKAYVEARKATNARFTAGGSDLFRQPGNHPVQSVNWHVARAYCDWLTKTLRKEKSFKNNKIVDLIQTRQWCVALPSELEWEKAARGGKTDLVFPWGNHADANRANYSDPGGKVGGTSPVGCFAANDYGLYDMVGNFWEWTRSLWGKEFNRPTFVYPYDSGLQLQRENLDAANDVLRVVRGGSWGNPGVYARCASRSGDAPDAHDDSIGLRLMLRPPLKVRLRPLRL